MFFPRSDERESDAARELRDRTIKYFDGLSHAFSSGSEAMQEQLYGEYVSARSEHPTEVRFSVGICFHMK
jgi:hypothetical protein